MIKKDLTGQKFEKLNVVKFLQRTDKGQSIWLCQCDCGNLIKAIGGNLTSGNTKSCGCLRDSSHLLKHGMNRKNIYNRFYKIWQGMKQRCLNKNHPAYKYYGEHDIKICDKWLESFNNFKDDMYESYLEHCKDFEENNTSIDRINNDLGYSLDNCRWATDEEQHGNRRGIDWNKIIWKTQKFFKAISPDGKEFISNNQSEFARENDLNSKNINQCLLHKKKTHKKWKFIFIK